MTLHDFSVWSEDGCRGIRNGNKSVTCMCNHTTSYAVLMTFTDYTPSEDDEFILTVMTYVGCAISLIFLTISFVLFVYLE